MTWRGDIMGGELRVTPSLSYRSDYHLFDIHDPILDQDGYVLADASVIWTAPSERWEIGLFGRNLTDVRYRVGAYSFPGATYNNSISAFYGPPTTYSARLTVKF